MGAQRVHNGLKVWRF